MVVRADSFRLKQVLLNLLSNAIKYNRQAGSVSIDCQSVVNDRVRITVRGTGPGIAATDFPVLFDPFSRLYLNTYVQEGAGIGLAITKQLVEMMAGTIGLKSELGEGSCFWIELALSASEANNIKPDLRDPATAKRISDNKSQSVLYIEDNPSHRALMKAIFAEQSNLQLSTVDTPNQGLELALQQLPNLIVCDISLPEMDGFQVLKELQQHQQTRDIPVIALSANAAPELIEKSLRAGFQRYHTKPINLKEFKQSLDELLNDG